MAEPPEKQEAARPENAEAWATTTNAAVGNAKVVTGDLLAILQDVGFRENAKPERPRYKDRGPKAQKVLDDRLSVTKEALDSVEASSQRCAEILHHLQHERQAKWAATKVCEWRLALRERRPKQELFRDHLQEALESEMATLEESRKVLATRVDEVKIFADDCDANKAELMRCVRFMILAGETNPPPRAAANSNSGPESPTGGSPASPGADPPDEGDGAPASPGSPAMPRPAVPSDPAGLARRAPQLHEITMQLVRRGEKLILVQRDICERANARTLASFRKRLAENSALKKELEEQMAEMDRGVASAEKSISRMQKNIKFFKQVELQPKVDVATEIVQKIGAAKHALEEDYHRKVVSMRIDDCCRKITAERTGQPPETMPVAAILEGTGTKPRLPTGRRRRNLNDTKMVRNNSSPAFVNGDIESAATTASTMLPPLAGASPPSSPAGASSPLKAAAAASISSKAPVPSP